MNNERKLRGRAAIEEAHQSVWGPDEVRLDIKISDMYGVEIEEALDIHANYHAERIFRLVEKRAFAAGMTRERLSAHLAQLEFAELSRQVAKGALAEPAAADIIYRSLEKLESKSKPKDRYVNFYG